MQWTVVAIALGGEADGEGAKPPSPVSPGSDTRNPTPPQGAGAVRGDTQWKSADGDIQELKVPPWPGGDIRVSRYRRLRGGGEPPRSPPPRAIPTTVHCSGSPGGSVVFMDTNASREGLAIRIRTRKIR